MRLFVNPPVKGKATTPRVIRSVCETAGSDLPPAPGYPSSAGDRAEFDVLFLMMPGRWDTAHILAIMGPGDHGEPVLTIMLPEDE